MSSALRTLPANISLGTVLVIKTTDRKREIVLSVTTHEEGSEKSSRVLYAENAKQFFSFQFNMDGSLSHVVRSSKVSNGFPVAADLETCEIVPAVSSMN